MRYIIEKSLDFLEKTIRRNVDIKGDPGEISHRNKEDVIGNWRSAPYHKVSDNLA